jgi:hypothetical protein
LSLQIQHLLPQYANFARTWASVNGTVLAPAILAWRIALFSALCNRCSVRRHCFLRSPLRAYQFFCRSCSLSGCSVRLARDTELSSHAYRAAIVIRTHANGYELSSVSLGESQGWGRARTRTALRELIDARWLVIRPYKTADGKRACEEYHVHAARKFNPEESIALAEPVILGSGLARTAPLHPTGPTPWPDWDQPPGPAQATKEDHLENQQENKKENQVHPVPTDCWGCRTLGPGCITHAVKRALVSVSADEPDWG